MCIRDSIEAVQATWYGHQDGSGCMWQVWSGALGGVATLQVDSRESSVSTRQDDDEEDEVRSVRRRASIA